MDKTNVDRLKTEGFWEFRNDRIITIQYLLRHPQPNSLQSNLPEQLRVE